MFCYVRVLCRRNRSRGRAFHATARYDSSPRGPTAHVHRGVAFENRSVGILRQCLNMDLTRVGGKDDGGVDLMGWWWLPEDLDQTIREGREGGVGRWRRIRVLAQCKAETKKIGPSVVRELEGVLHRFQHPPSPSSDLWTSGSGSADVVAVLVSQSLFTPSTLVHAYSSSLPLFLLHVPVLPPPTPPPPLTGTSTIIEAETGTGRVGGAFWNAALAGEKGVFRGKMELRWERRLNEHGRPGLWWEGTRVRTVEPPFDVSDPTLSM